MKTMHVHNVPSVNKMLSLSTTLYDFAIKQAKSKGIGFQEYIRYLVVKEKEKEDVPLHMVDEKTDKEIHKAITEMNQGTYTDFDDPDDALTYLKSI